MFRVWVNPHVWGIFVSVHDPPSVRKLCDGPHELRAHAAVAGRAQMAIGLAAEHQRHHVHGQHVGQAVIAHAQDVVNDPPACARR